MGHWQVLDHTADLAIEARGDSAEDALEALCRGLMTQISDPATAVPEQDVVIEVSGIDAPETLVSALGEILYWINVRFWVFSSFRVCEVSENRIRLVARGEPRDPTRHFMHLEVKAATYHDLAFDPDPRCGEWRARVVFDV
jgi:SHS2 domain-containing protein